MKICFIPIDNRPVCYNLAKDIAAIDENIELFIPPREFLGDLTRSAGVNEIIEWIENIPECDAMVISLDTIAYGGLIPSRRSPDSIDKIKIRLNRLKPLLEGKKVYAFSSIMRISNNNYNEEEKEYWKDWGKKIFEYSYSGVNDGIPQAILDDYLATRKRNFEINKTYLNGGLNTLIFSKDDCAPKGFNVDEARELERLGAKTKTGADEIPLTLLARAIEKEIKVFVEFTEPDYKDCISNYEDVSIEKSVQGQLELGGFTQVQTREEADVILIVNNFIEKQGEHVMGWTTQPFRKTFTPPDKPYAIADVRYANGADNDFVEQLLPQIDLKNFYGYAGWNTSANTIGSLLAGVKVRWNAGKYNEAAFKRLQIIRFLDDWAYQANVRGMIENPCDIQDLMKPYEIKLAEIFGQIPPIEYLYPWSRKFEVEISI
ncbi:TPA: DUF4127 domain-containing protein [Candidatus Gastranaerophilales bacterium HUM_3]|nr:putative uncharacterized protein [Acinetobacter sp. CAG:196]DAA87878.1 MAG TPA: DUF4127 domain-containing protein [Candidatus Gastranaerophilales bacterium HUM_3]DAA95461.1 MAG TPA: DUF4127 domain-containing protein [Candidatus Gastranaerophilales bacterium HUM_8]DAB05053.1 MAG TPA: DUF4127 domain-containing protein [Candidatus Gastranaerophilales bacterium HUM_11]